MYLEPSGFLLQDGKGTVVDEVEAGIAHISEDEGMPSMVFRKPGG